MVNIETAEIQIIDDGDYTYIEKPLTQLEMLHWMTGGAI